MERSTLGLVAGTGCGCSSFVVSHLVTAGVVVAVSWFTWDSGIQSAIDGPVSMGIGSVVGILVGLVVGVVVFLVMNNLVGRGSPEPA